MKKTFKIAKLELSNLFYSPIAWFLLIVFLFQAALIFTNRLEAFVRLKDLTNKDYIFPFLTSEIFGGSRASVFTGILNNLYLYMPLLTMGLISREMSSGTISLLYSSPVKVREIVLGKFLAMIGYSLMLVFILLIFGATAFCFIPHMDIGLFISGLLSIFLLLATYSSIGLFMSCLTNYQIVSALSTFLMFAFLNYVGSVWQGVDFIRDLTYFLAIGGRTGKMIGGLITTKDVVYFILITIMFLSFSIIKLQSGRETKAWYVKLSRYAVTFIAVLCLGYLSSRPGYIGYWDVTSTKANTITESAQKIIEQLDSPLTVTSYINYLGPKYSMGAPNQRNMDFDRWEKYIRFKKDIKLNYVYYYDKLPQDNVYAKNTSAATMAKRRAEALKDNIDKFETPEQIHQQINLLPENNDYVMQLKYKGRTTFLRLFNDLFIWPSETEVSAALKRLIATPPKIGFLQGGYERSISKPSDDAYSSLVNDKSFRYSLINQGFDIDSISVDSARAIPADIAALVIADPRKPLDNASITDIKKYIAAGGNMMILSKAGKQDLLNPLLQTIGVQFINGEIIQGSANYAQDIAVTYLTKQAAAWSPTMNGLYSDSVKITMPGTAAIQYSDTSGFNVTPLVMTDSAKSWNRTGTIALDSAQLVYTPALGDNKGPFATVIALTRKINGKEQRIIVSGDADMMSNAEVARRNMGITGNFQLNTALFGWFTYGAFPIDSYRPKSKDHILTLTDAGDKVINIIFLWILPVLLLISGTILLIRRKRK